MPQFCPKHAQTMPKIYPNLFFIVEIFITRLMSHRRRDITVDRGGTTVSRTHAHMVVFTGGRVFGAFLALLAGPSRKQTCSPTSGPHLVGHWLSKMLSWPLQEGQKCSKSPPASKNRRISRWGYPPSTDSGSP